MRNNPFSTQMALRQLEGARAEVAQSRAAHYANGRPMLDSTDALLEAVLRMELQVVELRAVVAEIREAMHSKPQVVTFPGNALKWRR